MKYMINSYFISSLDKLTFTFLDQSTPSSIQVKPDDLKYLQANFLVTQNPLFKVGVKQTTQQQGIIEFATSAAVKCIMVEISMKNRLLSELRIESEQAVIEL